MFFVMPEKKVVAAFDCAGTESSIRIHILNMGILNHEIEKVAPSNPDTIPNYNMVNKSIPDFITYTNEVIILMQNFAINKCGKQIYDNFVLETGELIIAFNELITARSAGDKSITFIKKEYDEYSSQDLETKCKILLDTVRNTADTIDVMIANPNVEEVYFDNLDVQIKIAAEALKKFSSQNCESIGSLTTPHKNIKDRLIAAVEKYQALNKRRGDAAASWLGVILQMAQNIFGPSECKTSCEASTTLQFFQPVIAGYCSMMCILTDALTVWLNFAIGMLIDAAGVQ